MQWSQIIDFLRNTNTQYFHFVKEVHDENDLGPILVAFANQNNGGKVFIGLDLINAHLVGTTITSIDIEKIITKFCYPIIKVKVQNIVHNHKKIVIISVAEGKEKPYLFNKKCYLKEQKIIRVADKEAERMLYERNRFCNFIQNKSASENSKLIKFKKKK